MYELNYNKFISCDPTVIKVEIAAELYEIPKAFVVGYGDKSILVRGSWAVRHGLLKEGDLDMPKGSATIGRKACMDAMCHSCEHFNAEGRSECERTFCPMFPHSPYAKNGLQPDTRWALFKTGKAVGFVPAKGVSPTIGMADAARELLEFRYGSLEEAPQSLRMAVYELTASVKRNSESNESTEAPPPANPGW